MCVVSKLHLRYSWKVDKISVALMTFSLSAIHLYSCLQNLPSLLDYTYHDMKCWAKRLLIIIESSHGTIVLRKKEDVGGVRRN